MSSKLLWMKPWDEKNPHDIAQNWESWLDWLHLLGTVGVNQSFIAFGFCGITSAQLHHFCDASEVGYGAVSHLTNTKGQVCVSFAFGKAKLAHWSVRPSPEWSYLWSVRPSPEWSLLLRSLPYVWTWCSEECCSCHYQIQAFGPTAWLSYNTSPNKTRRFKTYVSCLFTLCPRWSNGGILLMPARRFLLTSFILFKVDGPEMGSSMASKD